MARSSRFDANAGKDIVTLDTYEAVTGKLHQTADKLIIILFNGRHPDQNTLESRMKSWHKNFEKTYNVQFFKCIIFDGKQDIKEKFKIKRRPTVIFFLNNKEIGRIDDFDESNPDVEDTSKPGHESNDEKKLKNKIIEFQPKK